MGLDTVELIVNTEKYFNVSFSRAELAQLFTVGQLTDAVCKHLSIIQNDTTERDVLMSKIATCLKELSGSKEALNQLDLVTPILPISDKGKWRLLEDRLQLVLPVPEVGYKQQGLLKKWFPIPETVPYNWATITLLDLTQAVCLRNFRQLIHTQKIANTWEVYTVVAGLTVEQSGIDYYFINHEKSFTTDLGLD